MRLRFTPRALAELDDILAYLAQRSQRGAARVAERLEKLCLQLEAHAFSGQRTSEDRVRRIVATPYPYIVYYEIYADEVVVIGVRHGARNPTTIP